jgi:ABC-2 type transport system permease protein
MIRAVFKRNFFAYFINPTGYVFITVFILLGAMCAFWQRAFFLNNLANLDQLNVFYPLLLLFFVPALTMNVWSEERRQGTDELLFTLPGRDLEIVVGKYLAVLGIFTVAILFSLSHLLILAWLGNPDLGLMTASYLGYWLTGAALLAVGMVASLLTANGTVAFILGAVFCSALVFMDSVETLLGANVSTLVARLGIRPHFQAFGEGAIPLSGVLYFIGLTLVMLYVNVSLVGRRHFRGGEGAWLRNAHLALRTIALVVIAAAVYVIVDRSTVTIDATAERLHTLQPQTRTLLEQIPEDRPVFIQAFFSADVPEPMIRTRKNLLNVLRRMDDDAGDRVQLVVNEVESFSELAASVQENYGIIPRRMASMAGNQRSSTDVYMGLVFTSGPDEFVLPFFDRGLPVEYELVRSIRTVSRSERKTLGVLVTDAPVFGGFDFQTMASRADWSFVTELRKQYEVVQVPSAGPYPENLDALLAILPSSLTQPDLDLLQQAVLAGTPTLILDDPMPMFNPQLSPSLPKDAGRNPFQQQGQPPAPPKGAFDRLLHSIGLSWRSTGVVWSAFNPHPALADAAAEIVFVVEGPDQAEPFNATSPVSSGLQEIVLLYSGFLVADRDVVGASLEHAELLRTGPVSGETDWNTLLTRNLFGMQLNPNPRRFQTPEAYTLAMEVTGTVPAPPPVAGEGESTGTVDVHVIVSADIDIVSETFFDLRRQGFQGLSFDNVTFALNCIDVLAGDESFVALRKHRPRHRTLTRVEARSEVYADEQRAETDAAETLAAEQMQQAQQRLNRKVAELRDRTDLDEQTKNIMLATLERDENRRLDVQEATIELEKQRRIAAARAEMERAVAGIQRNIKWWAAALPPIPTLLLAIALFAHRFNRERRSVGERRGQEVKP